MGNLSLETPGLTTTTTPANTPVDPVASRPKQQQQQGAKKKKKQPVLDSWEDASSESESELPTPLTSTTNTSTGAGTPTDAQGSSRPPAPHSGFHAPPPTPASPSYGGAASGAEGSMPWARSQQQSPLGPVAESSSGGGGGGDRDDDDDAERKRPEKTDAVARRMIAGALGMRAPRPTEEQRAYDRAVREKERRRRDEEREAERRKQEADDKARAAIWND